jgi:TonB-dependent SusC/RagA subfamily outer membrane receptor
LLLTSDLKGYVQNPAYYFNGNKIGRPEDLDNLMITQGWRRFKWQPILAGQETPPSFAIEKGLVISGQAVVPSKNKTTPLALTKLTFIPIDTLNSPPQEVTTDQNGRFQLKTFDFLDAANLMYHAFDKKGKKIDVTVLLDSVPLPEISKPAFPVSQLQPTSNTLSYIKNAVLRSKTDSTYALFDTKQLAEVVVEGKKVKQTSSEMQGGTKLHSDADAVLVIDDKFPPTSNIYDMMSGRLAGVQVVKSTEGQSSYIVTIRNSSSFQSSTQPLYLLDGLPIEDPDGNALMSFSPLDVARIEVLKGASASMYGVRGGNGVIAIYSKKGGKNTQQPVSAGTKSLKISGFQYPREFYSPAYDVEKNEYIKPDYRATLYWAPLLYTDEKGNAKVSFFNSDKATRMQILIEGISASGMPVIFSTTLGK